MGKTEDQEKKPWNRFLEWLERYQPIEIPFTRFGNKPEARTDTTVSSGPGGSIDTDVEWADFGGGLGDIDLDF